jgi:predicted HTH transcriptional regulator
MFRDKDPRKIAAMALEYISAFLNSDGGSIYFGINDDSIVHGLEVDNRWLDQFQLAIDSDGRNHLNPPLIPQKYKLKIIPVVHQKKFDLKVIQIQVFPQSEA